MCLDKSYNYSKVHLSIKQQVEKADSDFCDLMNVLKAFRDEISKPINKEDLEKFPLLVWVDLNDKVKIRRRKNLFNNYLNFDTKLLKDGEFGEHFHEDIIENTEIIKGKVLDKTDNKIYYQDDIMHYEKGEKHIPVALEDTILKVIFKP